MGLHSVKVLGISITNTSKKEILEHIQKRFEKQDSERENLQKKSWKCVTIVTPNPEQIVYAQKKPWFMNLLNKADIAIPDGIGVMIANKIQLQKKTDNKNYRINTVLPGVSFADELMQIAAKERVRIALIGGKENVALKAFECLRQKYPGLSGVAEEAPDFEILPSEGSDLPVLRIQGAGDAETDQYFSDLGRRLDGERIGMVLVGLGAPKQELFINQLVHSPKFIVHGNAKKQTMNREPLSMNSIVFMSVGGTFDEWSGRIPPLPEWVSRVGMKWAWRLMKEPWRWKRQVALVEFIGLVLRSRLAG